MDRVLDFPVFLIELPATPQPPGLIVRSRMLVEVTTFCPGDHYYVGFQIRDHQGYSHCRVHDKLVTTPRFALALLGDPLIIFVSRDLVDILPMPLKLVEGGVLQKGTVFDETQVTLVG